MNGYAKTRDIVVDSSTNSIENTFCNSLDKILQLLLLRKIHYLFLALKDIIFVLGLFIPDLFQNLDSFFLYLSMYRSCFFYSYV